mmetsp:Transcript_5145/g.12980  ORF Transcript_5145/g.12980 Transcript_5145/m.12980 type:complete len:225 (+) Transcript_5145:1248-1922(+)
MLRAVSSTPGKPWLERNHCLFSSTRLMKHMSVLKIRCAREVYALKRASRLFWSSRLSERSTSRRAGSSLGFSRRPVYSPVLSSCAEFVKPFCVTCLSVISSYLGLSCFSFMESDSVLTTLSSCSTVPTSSPCSPVLAAELHRSAPSNMPLLASFGLTTFRVHMSMTFVRFASSSEDLPSLVFDDVLSLSLLCRLLRLWFLEFFSLSFSQSSMSSRLSWRRSGSR